MSSDIEIGFHAKREPESEVDSAAASKYITYGSNMLFVDTYHEKTDQVDTITRTKEER